MNQGHEQIIAILSLINNDQIETFKNFPDIIRAGKKNLASEEVDFLIKEGYIEEERCDSFGKMFHLSNKAIALLNGLSSY
jgi:hypothetical protein